jgi:hypothetical protein
MAQRHSRELRQPHAKDGSLAPSDAAQHRQFRRHSWYLAKALMGSHAERILERSN